MYFLTSQMLRFPSAVPRKTQRRGSTECPIMVWLKSLDIEFKVLASFSCIVWCRQHGWPICLFTRMRFVYIGEAMLLPKRLCPIPVLHSGDLNMFVQVLECFWRGHSPEKAIRISSTLVDWWKVYLSSLFLWRKGQHKPCIVNHKGFKHIGNWIICEARSSSTVVSEAVFEDACVGSLTNTSKWHKWVHTSSLWDTQLENPGTYAAGM